MGSKYGLRNIDAWGKTKDGETLLYQWDNLVVSPGNLPALHNQYRGPEGRPYRTKTRKGEWKSRIVVEQGQRAEYIKLVQSHVGRWKAKWAYAAWKLGDEFPSWISRHFDYVSSRAPFTAKLDGPDQRIEFGSSGVNFRKDIGKIQSAIKFRTEVIVKRIKLIISGYNKQVAQKIRISAQAHKHNEPLESVD
jgi:hypothetical protein